MAAINADILQMLLFLVLLLLLAVPLGRYMARVFTGERTWLDPVLKPLENLIYRLTRVDPSREMNWREYAVALLLFNFLGMAALYLLQRLQGWLPFNPQQFGPMPADL